MSHAPYVPPRDGSMNKTEAAYAELLEGQRVAGTLREWHFEAVTLKIAHDCRYTPDFLIVRHDGAVELHEVKGFWRDDAKVKTRVAARVLPFPIYAVQRDGRHGWRVERVAA